MDTQLQERKNMAADNCKMREALGKISQIDEYHITNAVSGPSLSSVIAEEALREIS